MQIEPLGGRIIIKVEFGQKVTKTGLITMKGSDEYPSIGTLVTEGLQTIHKGDKLYFRHHKFEEIEEMAEKDAKYLIGSQEDVLAIVHD